jgi:hypothetical protein
VRLVDLETYYSLTDIMDHNDALDLRQDVQRELHERQMEKMNDGR